MKAWFDYLIDSTVNIFNHIILDLREIFWDFFFLMLQKVLNFAGWLNSYVVGLLPEFDASTHWASVPATAIQLLNYMHFRQCLTIIITALVVRFTLNFIPFFK